MALVTSGPRVGTGSGTAWIRLAVVGAQPALAAQASRSFRRAGGSEWGDGAQPRDGEPERGHDDLFPCFGRVEQIRAPILELADANVHGGS